MVLVVVAVAVSLAVIYVGFVRRQEREAMVLAILLMLVASPLVWTITSRCCWCRWRSRVRARPGLGGADPDMALPTQTGVAGWQEALVYTVAGLCLSRCRERGSRFARWRLTRPLRADAGAAGRNAVIGVRAHELSHCSQASRRPGARVRNCASH